MKTQILEQKFLSISNSPITGSINCSSAAPAIGSDARTAIFISLTNPSLSNSVQYAVYDNATGHEIDSGTLSKGSSKSVIVPAQDNPHVIRIQNQSPCDPSHITPTLSYAVVVQQG